ncbi:MAG: ATP-binding cassette domain-containing protein [Betaproteobacteria bacterium]|nr:ATP-binding cassette domain-containing protein [Betaproteobacteria bacterium]
MIVLRDVQLRRGAKVLLERANVTIHPGEKVGLVGANGIGKSSLMALLLGQLHEDRGECLYPAGWRIAQVAQHMPESESAATAFVLEGDTRLQEAQAELLRAQDTQDGMALAHAHNSLEEAGVHDAPSRAQTLLLGLGFAPHELEQPVNSFSGGWRMRLQLARALMCPADLLLLDEPTNHLDLDALVWLESWLQRFEGTVLVISHDREFLDTVTTVTLHLEHQDLKRYSGNYSAFEDQRAQQLVLQQAAYDKQQDRIAHLQRFIDRFKAKATKARQAQSRVKALERMERLAPLLERAEFSFEFREPESLPNPMLSLQDASMGYGDVPILRGVNLTVLAGQRIGILGANGQGKSTLVKTLVQQLPLMHGRMVEGKGLTVGYFAQQELDVLHAGDTPLEHLTRLARSLQPQVREQELRNFLGSFRFVDDMMQQPVGTLSGGEKARLVLALIVWQRPNLLVLDEPTNHLDLDTREALGMALNDFDGTVLLVSHDRSLLRTVCEDFWLVSEGVVKPFEGDLEHYQQHLLEAARKRRESWASAHSANSGAEDAKVATPRESRKQQAQRRAELTQKLQPWRQEMKQLDSTMAQWLSEKSELEAALIDGTLSGPALAQHGKRLKELGEALEKAEERWLELGSWIEDAQSQATHAA